MLRYYDRYDCISSKLNALIQHFINFCLESKIKKLSPTDAVELTNILITSHVEKPSTGLNINSFIFIETSLDELKLIGDKRRLTVTFLNDPYGSSTRVEIRWRLPDDFWIKLAESENKTNKSKSKKKKKTKKSKSKKINQQINQSNQPIQPTD